MRALRKSTLAAYLLCGILLVAFSSNALSKPEHYSHTNSKGRTYYLFKKEVTLKNSDKVQTIYYFAKDPNNKKGTPMTSVPDDRVVSETKRGLLVLKKKTPSSPK